MTKKGILKRIREDEPEWEWVIYKGEQYLWRPEDGALYDAENLFPWGYRKAVKSSTEFWITQKVEPPSIEELSIAERPIEKILTPEEIADAEKAAKSKYWSDIMKKKKAKEVSAATSEKTQTAKNIKALEKKMKTLNL
jgi:hypothetical protein